MQTLIYFLAWGAFLFIMMRFGCGAHIMGHGHAHGGGKTDASASSDGARWNPPQKDTDPVCGMTVDTAEAKSTVHEGHVYYFCSQECRQKFEASPRLYTSGAPSSAHAMEDGHEHQH